MSVGVSCWSLCCQITHKTNWNFIELAQSLCTKRTKTTRRRRREPLCRYLHRYKASRPNIETRTSADAQNYAYSWSDGTPADGLNGTQTEIRLFTIQYSSTHRPRNDFMSVCVQRANLRNMQTRFAHHNNIMIMIMINVCEVFQA